MFPEYCTAERLFLPSRNSSTFEASRSVPVITNYLLNLFVEKECILEDIKEIKNWSHPDVALTFRKYNNNLSVLKIKYSYELVGPQFIAFIY